MRRKRHFIILGNGGGGTSCLRGLLNAHPEIDCLFEDRIGPGKADEELQRWIDFAEKAEAVGLTWGNKIPIEQFITRQYSDEDVVRLSDQFHIVWLTRRFSRYCKKHDPALYRTNWDWGRGLYWAMKEKHPETVLQVSFEDLLLRYESEAARMLDFLKVKKTKKIIESMLGGTSETGHGQYNQVGLNLEKA